MNINTIHLFITFCSIYVINSQSFAQKMTIKPDFTGFIIKYDVTFKGIGPEVYYLPKPQQKIEVLLDEYKKITSFNDTLKKAIRFQELTKNFEATNNQRIIEYLIQQDSLNINNYNKAIDLQLQAKNDHLAMGLLNEFAKQNILYKKYNQAEILLTQALEIANNLKDTENKQIVNTNLFALYLFTNNLTAAQQIEEETYHLAKKAKSLSNQGESLVKFAQIDAKKQNYLAAEQTILRKAIPLFNRAKDYDNKINAWITLSQCYISNDQYTEAQWFLIQAQKLAETHNITKYNTTIEYILGYAKYHQNNLNISKQELTKALALAKDNQHEYIQLAALQMLGQISIKQDKIDEAESYLDDYWELRRKLF